eukprot:snap_masked-scaffold_9-processed-gene-6.36-mRNA-1 protein AED:1.00 eAED:1.00 QI:0/0/0/0/1/1/2/0/64
MELTVKFSRCKLAPHTARGQQIYSKFLKQLEKAIENKNKRRLVILAGDLTAQIGKKEQDDTNEY